jgi:hypothetical protein
MRVTDEMVRRWLVWSQNYGEILNYRFWPGGGRRIEVMVPPGVTRDGQALDAARLLGHREEDVVPEVLMFTPREAYAFALGCAVGGMSRDRREWTQADWDARGRKQEEARRLGNQGQGT